MSADLLGDVEDAARDLVGAVGPSGIGRLDLTAEKVYADPRDGLDLLWAASKVDLPWAKTGTEGVKGGRAETVYWRSARGRSVLLRLYDKGVETGQAPAGLWLRLERQRRDRRERERTVADVQAVGFAELYIGRELRAIVAGEDDVVVCDQLGAVERIGELHLAGRLGPRSARNLMGYVVGRDWIRERRSTRYSREADLRRLGIALDRTAGGRRSYPLGRELASFAAGWAEAA